MTQEETTKLLHEVVPKFLKLIKEGQFTKEEIFMLKTIGRKLTEINPKKIDSE